MRREDLADLTALVFVAEEQNFTRAAARLGVSQSALSQIVRRLEERLGVRLLSRTTRSVSTTSAGERLVRRLAPMLREIDLSIDELSEFRDKPAGTLRVTTVEHAAKTVLNPALTKLLPDYPDINVEITIDYGLTDIVAERFDAGVRLGESVEKDMIAVRISPDIAMAVVGSPAYFQRHERPRDPEQLTAHRCINLRLPTSGALNRWRFDHEGRALRVRTEGQLTFNSIDLIRDAALAGSGLAYLPLDQVSHHLDSGALVQVFEGSTTPLPGYHLYYPSRRQSAPAFRLFLDAVRHR